MRAILLMLIFAVMTFYSIRRPWAGILVWSWFSYMNPHRFAYGFAYTFPWVAIIAGVTIVSWFLFTKEKWFPLTRETIVEVAFTCWFCFTTIFAVSPTAYVRWDRAFKIQIMIFMTLLIMRTRFHLEALMWTIVISLGIFGVKGGIWALMTGGGYRVQGPDNSMISDNNTIALALVMVIPLMRYLQIKSENKLLRLGLAAAQVLTVVAVLTTYSRGGLIALCVVGLAMFLKTRRKVVFALALLVIIPPIIRFMPDQWKERMSTIQETNEQDLDTSALGRLNAWAFALNYVRDHPLGGGFVVFISDAFVEYAPDPKDRHDSHSIYFGVLGEQGFPGLAMFLTMGICTVLTARRVIRTARSIPELAWAADLVSMAQVSLLGFATGGAFVGLAYFDLPYHLMAIVVLCKVLVDREIKNRRQSEPEYALSVEQIGEPSGAAGYAT